MLRNLTTGNVVATRVDRARSFFDRSIGLLARAAVRPDEGLWIERCGAIHTVGMRATIDVIFLDGASRVVGLRPHVRPFHPALLCRGAKAVVELGDGALERVDVLIGDRLALD